MADREGLKSYAVPPNVGGRFSVLSPVGLLPLAAAGVRVERLLAGAAQMEAIFRHTRGPTTRSGSPRPSTRITFS